MSWSCTDHLSSCNIDRSEKGGKRSKHTNQMRSEGGGRSKVDRKHCSTWKAGKGLRPTVCSSPPGAYSSPSKSESSSSSSSSACGHDGGVGWEAWQVIKRQIGRQRTRGSHVPHRHASLSDRHPLDTQHVLPSIKNRTPSSRSSSSAAWEVRFLLEGGGVGASSSSSSLSSRSSSAGSSSSCAIVQAVIGTAAGSCVCQEKGRTSRSESTPGRRPALTA